MYHIPSHLYENPSPGEEYISYADSDTSSSSKRALPKRKHALPQKENNHHICLSLWGHANDSRNTSTQQTNPIMSLTDQELFAKFHPKVYVKLTEKDKKKDPTIIRKYYYLNFDEGKFFFDKGPELTRQEKFQRMQENKQKRAVKETIQSAKEATNSPSFMTFSSHRQEQERRPSSDPTIDLVVARPTQ